MRRITTAVTAAALAFSMLALALPAAAVTGFDSQYNSESAFVNISPGQTQNFQVFFINAGTTTWTRGTSTQVDLAACLEDKVTCNAQDATEAGWNTNWLSSTRYATTSNTSVAPGGVATFSYNITAPAGAGNGIYRFNGDLVLSTTGERIHPEGYYQEANLGGVQAGTATLTSLNPTTGTSAGGDNVVLTGTGFQCTPAFPSVSFGGSIAAVSSCGSTSVTAVSPAHAPGAVTVTLTNSGQAASNGLTFTYTDVARPAYTGIAVNGNVATITWSEPVCRSGAVNPLAWNITTNSVQNTVTADFTAACSGGPPFTSGSTTSQLLLQNSAPQGAFIEGTLLEDASGSGKQDTYRDPANNGAAAPRTNTGFAGAPDTTDPTITSIGAVQGTTLITLNFSEPVWCGDGDGPDLSDITVTPSSGATLQSTGADTCPLSAVAAATSFDVTLSGNLQSSMNYTLSYASVGTDEVQDVVGNDLNPVTSMAFTTNAGDFSPPTMIDARMTFNAAGTDFADTNDSFTVTFSEKMANTTGTITIQDQDGTTATILCGPTTANCQWDTAANTTILTVTLNAPLVSSAGSTPGMAIPFDITAFTNTTDTSGNPPNVLGSSDRRVDFE